MRNTVFLLLIIISGCSSPKYAIAKEQSDEGGTYTLEILENKSLDIKNDGTGKLYYAVKDTPGSNVAVYKYNRKALGDYQDNFYNEEVVFEFTGKNIDLTSINKKSLLFGVSCYCKGKAGHYTIENAVIKQEGMNISIDVPAIIDNQIIDSVYIKSM